MTQKPTSLSLTREEVTDFLNRQEEFPAGLVALSHTPKDLNSEIAKALDSLNIAVLVMAPRPLEALDVGGERIVFFPKVALRVRVIQNVILNDLPVTGDETWQAVMTLLQGFRPQTPGVESPLGLAPRPLETAEFPGQAIFDVIFHYASHLHP